MGPNCMSRNLELLARNLQIGTPTSMSCPSAQARSLRPRGPRQLYNDGSLRNFCFSGGYILIRFAHRLCKYINVDLIGEVHAPDLVTLQYWQLLPPHLTNIPIPRPPLPHDI